MSNSYTWAPTAEGPEKLDPYSRWFLDTEGDRFRQDLATGATEPWFLSLSQKAGKDTKKTKQAAASGAASRSMVWEPEGSDYRFELTQTAPGENGKRKAARELFVQLAPLDEAMVADSEPVEPADGATADPAINSRQAVIFGLIDDGINIAHERFVDPSGDPRIDYAWLQDGQAENGSSVLFGREFTRAQIRSAREDFDTEERTLRALGLVDPAKKDTTTLSKSFSHGTFVLDCLAGYPNHHQAKIAAETDPPVDPTDRRIISVQLHRRVTEESSGALYPMFAIAGLQYIVDRARRVAKKIRKGKGRKIPLVVNFSYGISGGPHNGEHLFEQYVDQLVTSLNTDADLGPLIVPMPTGNRHLLEGHAHVGAEKTEKRELNLNWIIQPQDRTPNYLEIWVPKAAKGNGKGGPAQRVSLTLSPPFALGETRYEQSFSLADFKNGEGHELKDNQGNVVARVSLDALDADNADDITKGSPDTGRSAKVRILLALAPTYPSRDGTAHIPPGLWNLRVSARIKAGQYIEAWVQRDDSPPQFRRLGRQSYLENRTGPKEGRTRDSLTEYLLPQDENAGLSRYGAINGLATGRNMLRVSGVRHYDSNLPSLYSGATHKGMRSIEVAAPSDRSLVFRGLVGTGGRSGSSQVMNGTSVSAPIVGRAFADFLSQNTFADAKAAIDAFVQGMTHSANTGSQVSANKKRLAEEILDGNPGLKGRRTGAPIKTSESPEQATCPGSLRR